MENKVPKYDKDGPFEDPVVRCTQCQFLMYREDVGKYGMCKRCGNKRVMNVLICSDQEMDEMKQKGIDPEFIALFEGVPDV